MLETPNNQMFLQTPVGENNEPWTLIMETTDDWTEAHPWRERKGGQEE